MARQGRATGLDQQLERSLSPAASPATPNVSTRLAAISIARGIPSSLRDISLMQDRVGVRKLE